MAGSIENQPATNHLSSFSGILSVVNLKRLPCKLLFLVLNRSEKEWRMPPREWSEAKAQMAVLFSDRFAKAMVA